MSKGIARGEHAILYRRWNAMKERCYNTNCKRYNDYGGRGITVCTAWHDVQNFIAWSLSNGFNESLQLDRIDNDGNYCPENCRWAPPSQNRRNTRLSWDGIDIEELAKMSGINKETIRLRVKAGWPIDKLTIKPSKGNKWLNNAKQQEHKRRYQ